MKTNKKTEQRPFRVFQRIDRDPLLPLTCRWVCAILILVCGSGGMQAADDADMKQQLELLRQQNDRLQQQVQKQQQLIENLGQKVSAMETSTAKREGDARATSDDGKDGAVPASRSGIIPAFGKVNLSGEGGLAFFRSEAGGKFPNSEMRVDEAKLFVEAPIWKDVYFFTELNLYRRQDPNDVMNVGELYLDFENLSRLWNQDGQLNLRAGRFDIPFGEEYLTRDSIDNVLISHSLADFWGVDEGIELYGAVGKLQYVLAVQNGGHPSLRDYNADKAIVARLGYDPAKWLHLGASAMRTGALDAKQDFLSELWFGDGFVRSLGGSNTTTFQADVFQGDVQVRWRNGHLNLAGGYLHYTDNDPAADNGRDVYFYSIEAMQHLTKKLYAGARFSQILAKNGFPLVGDGEFGEYFFEELTDNLWRLSLGVGYRFSPNLLLKTEYSFNQGREIGGEKRAHENLVAAEVAFKF